MSMVVNKNVTELTFIAGLNPYIQDLSIPDSIKNVTIIRKNKGIPSTGGRAPAAILSIFSTTSNAETVTIDYGAVKPIIAIDCFRTNISLTKLKTIHFLVDTSSVTGWDRFLYKLNSGLHDVIIDGTPIDFSGMTKWDNTLNFNGLKEIRFVPDKIAVSNVTIANTYTKEYSNETWASLANALKSGQNGTFDIGATAISTLSAIRGFDTSGLFILDATGSMTLYDFVTTVKQWTVI